MVIPAFQTITWGVEERIGYLFINLPPANPMTVKFFDEMAALKELVLHESSLKAIIIAGNGRHFSSGADLDELLDEIYSSPNPMVFLERNYLSLNYLEDLTIPVISAIRGVCLGSALELALFCHFRFCSAEAVFGLPETTFNLIPGIGGTQRLVNLCGQARALEYILTGRTFDAHTALESGIVDRIWPKNALMDHTRAFVQQLPERYSKSMRKVYLLRHDEQDS